MSLTFEAVQTNADNGRVTGSAHKMIAARFGCPSQSTEHPGDNRIEQRPATRLEAASEGS